MRLGLCCKFSAEPIRFRTTTARVLLRQTRQGQLQRLAELCSINSNALQTALEFCNREGIGCFRVNSQVLPLKTHPEAGYAIGELPESEKIVSSFQTCGRFARSHNIRLTFHPDQFVVLNSPDKGVIERSVEELAYQASVAEWIGADVINVHAGGGYGDKPAALSRLRATLADLPTPIRQRITLENDERTYSPSELLPFCEDTRIPLVYDVHHHRCNPDGMSEEAATQWAMKTWDREPLFHLSSPRLGWDSKTPSYHHDYIDPQDFPPSWIGADITVEIEAKAKEQAVLRLKRYINTHT